MCSDATASPEATLAQRPTASVRTRLHRFQSFTLPLRLLQFTVALIIFCYAALSPAPQLVSHHTDASLHFVGNILLFVSAWVALWGRLAIPWLVAFLLPFSCAIELAQYFSPGRVVDMNDMAVNVAGLLVGVVIAWALHCLLARLLR